MSASPKPHRISRRGLLIGGGAGVGLVLAWGLWPRRYEPNLAAAEGETILNAFLKIGTDGRVTVIVPQAEMGQGVWTSLPQILADELGADWRTIAVEPAPISPLYANTFFAEEAAHEEVPHFLAGVGGWAAREFSTRYALMLTGGSTSIRGFEQRFREAGAAARALLCMAAGARLGADWRACDTKAGFVVRGDDRLRFGELAAEAAGQTPPSELPLRNPGEGGISGKPMPRLDIPAKIDGSIRYAGDVRLPNMVFASVRHGPLGKSSFAGADRAAAAKVPGFVDLVDNPGWLAALATNWWAAERALDVALPRFGTRGPLPDAKSVAKALDTALVTGGEDLITVGDAATALGQGKRVDATYEVALAPHAAIEPLVATARAVGGRIEVWMPTQAPGLARGAIAEATGYANAQITLYPMPVGGGFGRKIENDAAIQATLLAIKSGKPIQLMWSRGEEMQAGRHRPPATAKLSASLAGNRIAAWHAVIAAPSTGGELVRRITGHGSSNGAERGAIDGATPPYIIPALSIAHAPADIGIETGAWRSVAHSYTCFFTEALIDELAAASGTDPLSFRMSQLTAAPRLARCLARVTAIGGWTGEPESGQGLAIHSAFGSHVALLAEIEAGKDGTKVTRLVAAVDCGRLINPDIARQQIESGLIWGLAATFGDAVHYERGVVAQHGFDELRLPRLADTPEILVEFVQNTEAPGGLAELAVPPVAPAIVNAIASATGQRHRSLPLA